MDVELRHLRALVAVADELNFTRAAERLHLTQQALSGQIRQLEARVGTRLVDRDTRRVAMTPAGAELVERARPLLAGATDAVTAARAAGAERPRLTIGVVAPLVLRFTAPAMDRYAAIRPDVDVSVHFGSFMDPWGGLRDASADVAIVYGRFDDAGLERHFLFSEPRGLVVSRRHPLAGKEVVTIEEVLDQPIVDVPVTDTVMRDYWTLARERGGRPLRLGAQVQTLDGIIEAVGAGLGVALTTESAVLALGASAGITFRPVPGIEPLEFSVAHRAGDDRQTVRDFIRAALDVDVMLPWAPPAADEAQAR